MRVVFDLGTNINREASLAAALERLSDNFELLRASSVYNSTPVGMANQPDYLNLALEAETDKGVEEIRSICREIEDAMGRNRDVPKYGPRVIDIDLILYGETVDPELKLPHQQAHEQMFVVLPLAELDPEGRHPASGTSWGDLRRELLRGRSPQDAGISHHSGLDALPLGPKAKAALLKAV